MANSGDLQRLLSGMGASEVKLDTVTRKLRADGALLTRGRGPYAHDVTQEEAAKIVIAYMGSSKAAFAGSRLNTLADLKSDYTGSDLLLVVSRLLRDEDICTEVVIIRVSRRSDHATIIYRDGTIEQFCSDASHDSRDHVGTEGFMTGEVLRQITVLLRKESPTRRMRPRVTP